jgi:hypothetical protein
MTADIRQPGQERKEEDTQKSTGRTWQAEHGRQKRTGRGGQAENRQRTGKAGQAKIDR